MQAEIVAQGWELMLYGMGTVVLFLGLLIVATTLMSRIVGRYFPQPEPSADAVQKLRGPAQDPRLIAVISAAIHRHRLKKK